MNNKKLAKALLNFFQTETCAEIYDNMLFACHSFGYNSLGHQKQMRQILKQLEHVASDLIAEVNKDNS